MKYGVFDNGRPASKSGFPEIKGTGWLNHIFDTYNDARRYAINWLGADGGYGDFEDFKLNTPYDYSGRGDMIEIKEIKKLVSDTKKYERM